MNKVNSNSSRDNSKSCKPKTKRRNKFKTSGKGNENTTKEGYMTSTVTPNVITKSLGDNDASWYTHISNVAKDYASLPFNQVLGLSNGDVLRRSITTSITYSSQTGLSAGPYITPGIMTIHFMPTIGSTANGPTAPVNMSAQQLYTMTRRANSGKINYDKTDLMMLMVAMDSAYILYEDMLRAYRVMSTYNGVNRYYPICVLQALGYDSSIQYEIAKFRGILDMFAYKLASVNIPDQFDFITRHSWMCSNIYLDDEGTKSQSYAFVPTSIYKWNEGTDASPTNLIPLSLHPQNAVKFWRLDELESLIDQIMNPILGSEDVGVITGDLLKAFSENGMIKIRPVEDYAALVPVYSAEVLLQISNLFATTGPKSTDINSVGNINQVLTNTTAGPYLTQSIGVVPGVDGRRRTGIRPLLNFINEDTTPENVLVATRLISLTDVANSGGIASVTHYGTEIVFGMRWWKFNASGQATSASYDQDAALTDGTTNDSISTVFGTIAAISSFKNAPTHYLFGRDDTTSANAGIRYSGFIANINNCTFLDDDEIEKLHEVAVMSLFTLKDYNMNL